MSALKRNLIIRSLVFLFIFSIYSKALCPTVFVGDSGELITVSHILGVAHPTGYPLNTLMMKAFSMLPLDNIAARCNLSSSLFFSLVFLEILLLFAELGFHLHQVLPGLILLNFIPVIGKEATVARVYGLTTFLMFFLIRLTIRKRIQFHRKIFLWSFISGLALGNHLQILFPIILCGIFFFFRYKKERIGLRFCISIVLIMILGLSVYLEMPIRSHKNPGMDWENPENFTNFMQSISRSSFWYKANGFSQELLQRELISLFPRMVDEIGFFHLLISILGIGLLFFKLPSLLFLLGGTSLLNVFALVLHGSEYDLFQTNRYHIILFLTVFVGYIYFFAFVLSRFFSQKKLFLRAFVFFILIYNLFYGYTFFPRFDRSKIFFADDLAFNLESLLPPDSCIFLTGDNITFSTAYRHFVLHSRYDIEYIHRSVNLFNSPYLLSQLPIDNSRRRGKIESDIIHRHLYRAFATNFSNLKYMPGITIIPYRFIYKFIPQNWRFQKLIFHFQYFRNRPIPQTMVKNTMIQKSCNFLYNAGGLHEHEFNNLLKKAFILRKKILSGQYTQNDVDQFIQLYVQCGLKQSASHVSQYLKLKSAGPEN